ncbi:ABC transporter permease [Thermococcus sp. AM4]|uniref:ABC transporter permease n=1 Tax=Thermococcus sp. (strain AM4) TaxID=246969 RepID=UPI0001870C07|nr:ABC transporter permease [Thermococcus sp. AM4]EEB74287.1 putative ABC transporter, permease component [Thermococcus sp. AM4]
MKARAVKGIILKDLREIRREKMALFWVFVFPLMWITLLGGIWGGHNPPVKVDLGVVYHNESAPFTAGDVVEIMRNVTIDGVHIFKIREYGDEESALKALEQRRIDALLVFPEGFGENLSRGFPARVYAYFDRSDPQNYQIVSGTVKGFLSEFERRVAERRLNITLSYMEKYVLTEEMGNLTFEDLKKYLLGLTNPLDLRESQVAGESPSPIQFYVTSFIGIQFLFATMIMIGSGTLEEIEHGTLRRIAASPATAWDFLAGKMLSTFVVITISILIGIAYARLVFGETVFPGLIGWALIFLAAVFSMGLGLAIAMATGSIKATNALVNLISMPLLFLAGIVIPESILPGWARPIANYLPLGRALKDLRLLELYHRPAEEIAPDLLWLSVGAFGTLLIAVLLYNRGIKRME